MPSRDHHHPADRPSRSGRPRGGARTAPRSQRRGRTQDRGLSSLDSVAATFHLLTSGPNALTLDGALVGCGLPRRAIPLGQLRAILLHPATGRACRDAAWRHLIEAARTRGPAWTVGAAGVALPALRKMTAELAEGYRGDPADIGSAVLAGFIEGLRRIDTERPGVITRLRWAAYRAGVTARYTRDGLVPMPLPSSESQPPPAPWGHPDLILLDAVAKGVLSPLQAELIGRTRLEDLTLKDAAVEFGVGYEAACKARQRGEARLVAALRNGDVEHRLSAHGPDSGLYRASGAIPEPGRVRGRSTTSDGTSEPAGNPDEEGVFCGPAHRPTLTPAPGPGAGSQAHGDRARRRGTGRRRCRNRACTHRPVDGSSGRSAGEPS